MFSTFYAFIKNEDYNRSTVEKPQEKQIESKQQRPSRSRSRSNNKRGEATENKDVYDLKENGYNDGSDAGLSDSKERYLHKNDLSDTEDPRKPYNQIKHVFEIKVKELKNTPVLNKFIK